MCKTVSGNYHHRPSQVMASQLLMKECRLSELEPRASRNCGPNDVMAHPCQRHQRWPQELGHCLCPLLQRNLRLNSVARRRRDSSPREKKWFDAMCEEPFDAVAKVVVHSCGKLNVVLSVFVALTTNSIYIAVLLRPGTFPFWYRHRAYDLRAGAVFFVGHRLKSS
jgi:hypothetical protein